MHSYASLTAWKRRAATGAAAIALAAGLAIGASTVGAGQAYAADAMSSDGLVTASAFAAAEPNPEILGISNMGTRETSTGVLDWTSPTYNIWGTDTNSNPNPFYWNSVLNAENGNSDAQPAVISYTRAGGGPNGSMKAYGSGDAASDAVWDTMPDIILGNGQGVDYNGENYALAVGAAHNAPLYRVLTTNYTMTTIYDMIDSEYSLAQQADQVVADSNGTKKLRYDESATDIAKELDEYVRGTQGYILEQLAANNQQQKTVAYVISYDSATGTYTLAKTGATRVGTSNTSLVRYLEEVENVATNIAGSITGSSTTDNTITASIDDLRNVDCILIDEGQASTVLGSFDSELTNKSYWVADGTTAGSTFGTTHNSIENSQNIGRILGLMYPDYVDQDQWMAYYYDHFYHIADGKLGETIDQAMDGVRNASATGDSQALTQWTADDVADYNSASVQSKLQEGMDYLKTQKGLVSSQLADLSNYDGSEATLTFSDVNYNLWYGDAVNFISNRAGLIKGVGDSGTFDPDGVLTRAQFAQILYRYADADAAAAGQANPPADTTGLENVESNTWYTAAANWAVSNGIITGVNGTDFAPEEPVTSEQMVTMLYRYLGNGGNTDKTLENALTDANQISDWATDGVAWALNSNLMSGYTNADGSHTFGIEDIYRARAAQILYNGYQNGILQLSGN